jgi:hypothetical protein
MQHGLRDLVDFNGSNFGVASAIPPRMLSLPLTAVEREEKVRAFWMIEALNSVSTLGAAWNLSVYRPKPGAAVPCDDEIWDNPELMMDTYLFGSSATPSSFSLFASLATERLWQLHQFLQESYSPESSTDLDGRRANWDTMNQSLISWKAEFEGILAYSSPLYSDLSLLNNSASPPQGQHPNSILILCTIHSAVISLHQRSIFPIAGASGSNPPWPSACERCLASCDEMVEAIRGASDKTLKTMTPHILSYIFITARFYIIYSRAIGTAVPEKLYLLIYSFNVAAKRWPLARDFKYVLESAVGECWSGQNTSPSLPDEFYDLQYLGWDIYNALRRWNYFTRFSQVTKSIYLYI